MGMGPPWFIKALLLYNVCYALAAGTPAVKMPLPSFWTVAALNVLAQVIEIMRATFGLNDLVGFAGVPFSSGAVQALAFFTGCVAYRNEWLEALLEKREQKGYVWRTYLRAALSGVSMFIVGAYEYYSSQSSTAVLVAVLVSISVGVIDASLNFAMLDFFGHYFGKTSNLSKFLSSAAYAVYLIHPLVWSLVAWSFAKMLEASGFVLQFEMVGDMPTNRTPLPVYVIAVGWVYTVVLSQLLLWPLAWCIAKLPGLNKVL